MQTVFERNETKYLITPFQASQLVEVLLASNMKPGYHDAYWVQNLCYDTENWDIIHTSMEKPYYKEKMRLRCYGMFETTDYLFLELKKKCSGVAYKRRLPILSNDILEYSIEEILSKDSSQISKELAYHIQRTSVAPRLYIAYFREVFAGLLDDGLRLTLDSQISYRLDTLHFTEPQLGCALLNSNTILLEIKTLTNIPLWLAHLLCDIGIFSSSFSKYATCIMDWLEKSKLNSTTAQSKV